MLVFQQYLEVMDCYRYCILSSICTLIFLISGLLSFDSLFNLQSTEEAVRLADGIGFPVMIKVYHLILLVILLPLEL